MNTEAILSGIVLVLFVVLLVVLHKARKARAEAHGRDVGLAVFVEDPTCCEDGCEECGAPMVVDEEPPSPPPYVRTNLGFGRRNPHCSNCGDLRGGAFGHEASECKYRYGMTAGEVAAILPEHQRNEFWDEQIDRHFAEQERAS